MSKIYSYAEYLPIAKVGDVVRAVEGMHNACMGLKNDSSNTQKITEVDEYSFAIDGCWHDASSDSFLELVSPRIPTWEDLQVGDEVVNRGDKSTVLAVLGDVFAVSSTYAKDNFSHWMTKKEAPVYGWSFVTPPVEPEVEEMTLETVNKLLGKKVKIVE